MKNVKNLLMSGMALGLLVACENASYENPVEVPVIEVEVPVTPKVEAPEVEVEAPKRQEVKMGETLVIKEWGEEAFEMKVIDVRFTEARNEFYDKRPVENVVVIKAEVTNISNEEVFASLRDMFNLYDMDGNILDTYPNTDYEYSDCETLNPTRKATLEISYGIPTGTEFELEVIEDTWDGGALGSIFFKGTEPVTTETTTEAPEVEAPVEAPEVGEPVEDDMVVDTNDSLPYTLIQSDMEKVVYQFHGTLEDFMVQVLAESEEMEISKMPLTSLIMSMGMGSAFSQNEHLLLSSDGYTIVKYVCGEPVVNAME